MRVPVGKCSWRDRDGVTLLEVVVASLILAAVMVPMLELFQGGLRSTRATLQEVVGTNLAAELAEQLETLPFDVLSRACAEGPRQISSSEGSLRDGVEPWSGAGFVLRLSPLPTAFHRSLHLVRLEDDLLLAELRVGWNIGGRRERDLVLRRALTRDSLLPPP